MKAQTTSVYFFLLIFFLSTRLAAQDIPVDSVIKISCSSDAAQTYSLYLPKGFTTTKKYPVLLFLDPGGRGEVPVTRYRSVADSMVLFLPALTIAATLMQLLLSMLLKLFIKTCWKDFLLE